MNQRPTNKTPISFSYVLPRKSSLPLFYLSPSLPPLLTPTLLILFSLIHLLASIYMLFYTYTYIHVYIDIYLLPLTWTLTRMTLFLPGATIRSMISISCKDILSPFCSALLESYHCIYLYYYYIHLMYILISYSCIYNLQLFVHEEVTLTPLYTFCLSLSFSLFFF